MKETIKWGSLWLSGAFLVVACGGPQINASASPQSGSEKSEDASSEEQMVDSSMQRISLTKVMLGTQLSSGGPDCNEAQRLRDEICRLSEKVCELSPEEAGSSANDNCRDARDTCEEARRDVSAKCPGL